MGRGWILPYGAAIKIPPRRQAEDERDSRKLHKAYWAEINLTHERKDKKRRAKQKREAAAWGACIQAAGREKDG